MAQPMCPAYSYEWSGASWLACVAHGPSRRGAFSDTAVPSAVTDDSTGHRHTMTGVIVGAVAGGVFAYIRAQNDARKCRGGGPQSRNRLHPSTVRPGRSGGWWIHRLDDSHQMIEWSLFGVRRNDPQCRLWRPLWGPLKHEKWPAETGRPFSFDFQ
jgi:hypothetical protein